MWAYASEATLQHTYDFTLKTLADGVPGAVVECGVGAGANLAVMSKAVREAGSAAQVYGFDSFDGIPIATEKDGCQPGLGFFTGKNPFFGGKDGNLESSGVTVHDLDSVRKRMDGFGFPGTILRKGWFEESLADNSADIEEVAVLRMDCDLYAGTMVCMEAFYDKLAPTALVIIDDYLLNGCRDAVHEFLDARGAAWKIEQIDLVAYVWNAGSPCTDCGPVAR